MASAPARAQNSFSVTLPSDASVVMGDPSARLDFTVENDSGSSKDLNFLSLCVADPGDYAWLRDYGDPPGWEHKTPFDADTLRVDPTTDLAPGDTRPLETYVTGSGGGVIPAAASDQTDCLTCAEAQYKGGANESLTGGDLPCWTRRSLGLEVLATPSSRAVGKNFTVQLVITNNSTASQTSLAPLSLTTSGTGNVSLVSGPTPSTVTINAGKSRTISYTYQATQAGTLTWTAQVGKTGVTSPFVTSNQVVIGDFTSTLDLDPLSTTTGQDVTLTMEVCNNGSTNLGDVTPSTPSFTGSASSSLSAGPSPSIIPSLKKNSCGTFSWTYTITGSSNQTYEYTANASTTSGGGSSTTTTTSPEGRLGTVTATPTPTTIGSAAQDVEVCWRVGNTSGKNVKDVTVTFPSGWTYSTASGSQDGGGGAWTVTQTGNDVHFEAPNKSSEIPNNGTGTFCVTFSQAPLVEGDSFESFPVRVQGPSVDLTPVTQVLVTAKKVTLDHDPASGVDADGVSSYTLSARATLPLTVAALTIVGGNPQVTDAASAFQTVGVTVGDLLVIASGTNAGTYTVTAIPSQTALDLSPTPGTSETRAATVERPQGGEELVFTASQGSLSSTTAAADTSGVAQVLLVSPASTTDVDSDLTAACGTAIGYDQVTFDGFPGPNLLFVGGTMTPTTGDAGAAVCIEVDVRNVGDTAVTVLAAETDLEFVDNGLNSVDLALQADATFAVGATQTLEFCGTLHADAVNGAANLLTMKFRNAGASFSQDRPVDDAFTILNGTLARVDRFLVTPAATGGVVVAWSTAGEEDTAGFHVERATSPAGPWQRLTTEPIPGAGTTQVPQTYAFHDADAPGGSTFVYRVVEVEVDGDEVVHDALSSATSAPPPPALGAALADLGGGVTDPQQAGVSILEAGPEGYLVEVRVPRFDSVRRMVGGWVFDELALLDLPHARVGAPGEPRLPVVARLLPRPAGARPQVAVEEVVTETYDQVLPVPAFDLDGSIRAGEPADPVKFRSRQAYYLVDQLVPGAWAQVEDAGFGGATPLLRLRVHPLRVLPASLQLTHASRIRLRITFAPGGSAAPAPPRAAAPLAHAARTRGPALALEVRQPGLQAVRLADLLVQEPRLAEHPVETWRVVHAGAELPTQVEGTLTDPGASLRFVLDPRASKYADHDVAWLVAGGPPATRWPTAACAASTPPPSLTARAFVGDDDPFVLWAGVPGPDDHDRYFRPGWRADGSPHDTSVPLPGLAAGPAQVTLHGASVTRQVEDRQAQDVHLEVAGLRLATHAQVGRGLYSLSGTVPATAVTDPLVARLASTPLPGRRRVHVTDQVEVRYPRLPLALDDHFRATLPAGQHRLVVPGFLSPDLLALGLDPLVQLPVAVTGAGPYTAAVEVCLDRPGEVLIQAAASANAPTLRADRGGDLPDPAQPVDYLVIGPRVLLPDLAPLLQARQAQGLRAAVAPLEAIDDTWGGGRPGPDGVQRFLAHALSRWPRPAPRFLLLVGLPARDPRFRSLAAVPALGPAPAYMPTRPRYSHEFGETLSDVSLATVYGADPLPDLAVGRLPARTPEQVRVAVAKVLAYEALPRGDPFEERALLVADDGEAPFREGVEETRRALPPGTQALLARLGLDGDAATLRPAIQREWDQGLLITDFAGHGGIAAWTSESLLRIGGSGPDVAARLVNGARLPISVSRACQEGYAAFEFSFFPSRSETLLFNPNGGSIACFASAGISGARAKQRLVQAFMEAALQDQAPTLGEAVLAAQRQVLAEGADEEDALATHVLYGDPALRLHHPAPEPPRVVATRISQAGDVVVIWEGGDERDLAGYRIYRGSELLASLPASARTYRSPGGASAAGLTTPRATGSASAALAVASGPLRVVAVDGSGNESLGTAALPASLPSPAPSAAASSPGASARGRSFGCHVAAGGGPGQLAALCMLLLPWWSRRRKKVPRMG